MVTREQGKAKDRIQDRGPRCKEKVGEGGPEATDLFIVKYFQSLLFLLGLQIVTYYADHPASIYQLELTRPLRETCVLII